MSKLNRVFFSFGIVALAVLSVVALTFVGSRTEGPLGKVLADIGGAITRTESQVAFHIRGPGRAADLSWFDDVRRDRSHLSSPEGVLLGAYDNGLPNTFDGLLQLEDALEMPLPIVHLFTAWGDDPEYRFPRTVVQTIWEVGSVPMITWEPWLSTFDPDDHSHLADLEDPEQGGMAAVASGTYDFYLENWFSEAASFGRPLLVRFGHEMNDAYRYAWGPHNNRPEEYVAAFRHVVEMARKAGATNILWVWSPHIAYDGFNEYYPGDDVVDWVAATVLNYGNIAYWSEWWSFDDIFTRRYDRLTEHDKPIMIAEMGTLMAGGERAPWFERALARLPQRLPEVKAVVFFHSRSDESITYQSLNWAFDRDELVIRAIKSAIATWSIDSTRTHDDGYAHAL